MISFSSGNQDSRISTLLLSGLTHPRDAFALGKNCSQDFILGGVLTRKIWQLSKPEHQILQNFDIEFWFWWINLQTTESQPVRGRVYLCCECSCWKLVGESSEKDRAAVVAGCGGQSANSNSARFWGRQLEPKDRRVAILSHAISCSCVAWMWVHVAWRFGSCQVDLVCLFIGFCFNGSCLQAAPAESPAVLGCAMFGNGIAVTF